MSDTIHRKQFMDGRETPDETHRRLVFKNKVCVFCGDPKVAIALKLIATEKEFLSRHPNEYLQLLHKAGGDPCFETKYGKALIIDRLHACDMCKKPLNAYAAKQESWVICEFDEGGLSETYPKQVGSL